MNWVQPVFEKIFYKYNKTTKGIFFIYLSIISIITILFILALKYIDKNFFIVLISIINILIFFSFICLGKNAIIIFLLYLLYNLFIVLALSSSIFQNLVWVINFLFLVICVIFFYNIIDNIESKEKIFEIHNIELEKRQQEAIEKINKIRSIINGAQATISRYKILNSIAQKLSFAFDFNTINEILLFATAELEKDKPIKYTLIFYDEEIKRFRLIPSEKNDFNDEQHDSKPTSIKIYDNLDIFDEWILKFRYSLLIKNIDKDFRFKNIDKNKLYFKSLLAIPLLGNKKIRDKKNENEIIGILRFYSIEPEIIGEEDARLLNYLANLISNAIQNTLLFQETQKLAIKDGLTGLYLRRYFMERLDEEIKRAKETKKDLSFLLIDIDHFKQCNDTYGHLFGDKVLKVLGEFLKTDLREVDIIGRYGGEEFATILLNTNLNGARATAERLRQEFSKLVISVNENEAVKLTLSIGGICYKPEYKIMQLINLADKALYYSKENGRNRVTFWEDIS